MNFPFSARRLRPTFIGSVLVIGFLAPWWSPLTAGTYTSAVSTITREKIRHDCEFLASDALEGRETGSRGGQAAGDYIVAHLRKHKVRPAGVEGDYYQPFPPNSRNILCKLEGSDPTLAKEYVIVCAHYDHVGFGSARNSRGPIGYIHNGADDNASGVAALLELVDAFTSLDAAPQRSIVFAFWDAEEQGLLGSEYWCQSPTLPFEGLKAVFNIDMVGRLRDNHAEVLGSRTAPGLRALISADNSEPSVAMTFSWDNRRDSDHYPFFTRQIPYLMVFTGKHADYHTPYDDVDKLNLEGIERITRLLFRTVHRAAQSPQLPTFRWNVTQENGSAQEQAEAPVAFPPARLGVTWNEQVAQRHVIEVAELDPASAADAAGMRGGDHILKFNGVAINGAAEMREAVCDSPPETTAVIVHRGETVPQTLRLHLSGAAVPLGILCRTDDAEPGCVIVSRVIPGLVAERSGLRLNDRIRKVGARIVGSPEQLPPLLLGPSNAQSLQIERDGALRTLQLKPAH